MNSYELSRNWFDWCYENPEKISPNHSAIYFFAIDHCNRLGWKDKFGFPTQMAMDAIGIKKHQTYIRYLSDLIDWGFIKLIEKSKNQYSSNIISLVNAKPKNGKALGKAIVNHAAKHGRSTGQSNSSINKPQTNKPQTVLTSENPLINWLLENCPSVQNMEQPLSEKQAEDLRYLFTKEFIAEVFEAMDNSPKLKQYKSAFKTFKSWAKVRQKENPAYGMRLTPEKPKHNPYG